MNFRMGNASTIFENLWFAKDGIGTESASPRQPLSDFIVFQVLNLHGNGLSRLQHVTCMTALKKLTVSFNELTRLDEISHMV